MNCVCVSATPVMYDVLAIVGAGLCQLLITICKQCVFFHGLAFDLQSTRSVLRIIATRCLCCFLVARSVNLTGGLKLLRPAQSLKKKKTKKEKKRTGLWPLTETYRRTMDFAGPVLRTLSHALTNSTS